MNQLETGTGRIPVIKLWGVLLVPLQGDVSDHQAAGLVADVLAEIRRDGCSGLAIDLSGLWMVDSHLCAAFTDLASAAKYMGAQTVLCGLTPEVAMTLQSMGFELRGVQTMLTLEHALAHLGLRPASQRGRRRGGGRSESQQLADAMLRRNPPARAADGDDGDGT